MLAVFLMGAHEGVRRESGQFCRVCSATDCGCARNAELVSGESFKEVGPGEPELGIDVALAQIGGGKVCTQLHQALQDAAGGNPIHREQERT